MRERAGRKITENCPTVPIHYLYRLANFTGPRWGRAAIPVPPRCVRALHTHTSVAVCLFVNTALADTSERIYDFIEFPR